MKSCFECGNPASIDHHVVPFVLGGNKTIPLCATCHGKVHSPESALSLQRLTRRSPRGPSKIKFADAVGIITMRKNGYLLREIADRYNITITHAACIAKGGTRVSRNLV